VQQQLFKHRLLLSLMKGEVQRLLTQAEQDIASAQYNLDGKKYYLVAFLSQQAVEKRLKARYIEREKDLLKTHM
jgi:HEPN domain-containing protein